MISSNTKLLCIFGSPVKHSKSPIMHNAVLNKLGLDYVYMAFEVKPENLGEAVAGLKAMGAKGANITIPHKENVVKYLDYITEEAEIIGSVNTLFFDEEGKIVGDNTDGRGFIISLMKDGGVDPKGKSVVMIGTGGAARAVGAKLIAEGAKEIFLYDIIGEKALNLKESLDGLKLEGKVNLLNDSAALDNASRTADIIINCTPVGMKETDPLLLSEDVFDGKQFVFDLVYNPEETKLLKIAKSKGCKVLNGLGMLIYQGALSFERWTGEKPDTEEMFKSIKGE